MKTRYVTAAIALVLTGWASPSPARAAPIGSTVDGRYAATGQIGPGGQLDVDVLGRGGIPATGVSGVELNVTATEGTASSFVTVWPAGQAHPTSSTVNFQAGQTVGNTTIVGVGANGQVSFGNFAGSVHLVVDVVGWIPTSGPMHPLTPARIVETRTGYPTIDAQSDGAGAIANNETRTVQVAGRGGVPATGATSVVVNLSVTNPTAPGYVTLTPTGAPRRTTANINFVPGQTVGNMAIVPLGTNGQIDVYNYAGSTDVIVDVLAYSTSASGANFNPVRATDTRPGGPTADGIDSGGRPLAAGSIYSVSFTGRLVPNEATAVAINVVATNTTANSFFTVFTDLTPQPPTSNLNFGPGSTVANTMIVTLGPDRFIDIANYAGTADIVVDVLGGIGADASFTGLTPARLVDTRPVPTPPPTSPPPTQACTWGLSVSDQEGTGGQLFTFLDLTNTTAHDCVVPHVNSVTGHTISGSLVAGTEQTGFGTPAAGRITVGGHLRLVVSGPTNADACGLTPDPITRIAIDIGTTLTINLPRLPDGACSQLAYTQPLVAT